MHTTLTAERFKSSNLCKFYEKNKLLLKHEGTYLVKYIPKVKNKHKIRILEHKNEIKPLLIGT